MSRSLFALLALLCAASLAGADYVIEPPAPDTASMIRLTFLDGCAPADPLVTITGQALNIEMRRLVGYGCISAFSPYPVTFQIGVLPAGTYAVQINGKPLTTLVVREAGPFTIAPFAVPTTGGTQVVIHRGGLEWPPENGQNTIKFGGKIVATGFGGQKILVTAPPAPAGAVDVTVDARYYLTPEKPNIYTAHSALIYYDPAQPPNRSVAEPILFPVAFDGSGAYGSQWRTENSLLPITAGNTFAYPSFYRAPCDGCSVRLEDKLTLPPMARPDGLLLWIVRGTEQYAVASSRIRDVSRSDGNTGVSVPVVRGDAFKSRFVLPNVPIEPGNRGVLRLWSLDDGPVGVTVSGSASVNGQIKSFSKHIDLARVSDQGPLFASADLGSMLGFPPEAKTAIDVQLEARDLQAFWPMLSVTNNTTQQVTIIAPDSQ